MLMLDKKNYYENKGFTLIELLAVIVILVVIAIIVSPIITELIEDSKKEAFKRSVEGVVDATKFDIAEKITDNGYEYKLVDGVIENLNENVKISNTSKMNGTINYNGDAEVSYAIYNNKWCMISKDSIITLTEYDGNCVLNETSKFKNGDVVYFDILSGSKCDNYQENNSLTGYNGINGTSSQNSCLKFYAFNYSNGDERVNLLLDHNTTAAFYWFKGSSNVDGPKELLEQLRLDTDEWVGTEIPNNYSVSQEGYANYTIPYKDESYKARVISANEVAQIVGNENFDENKDKDIFCFDTGTSTRSETCKKGDTSGCKYGWLYDRTKTDCTTYGCLNDADWRMTANGYWTGTAINVYTSQAHFVSGTGILGRGNILLNYQTGLRPVIEVLVSKLS